MGGEEKRPWVAQGAFDPFIDRPARIVRNTLSEMLVNCLTHRKVFPGVPQGLRARYPQHPYGDYIKDRTRRYRRATREAQAASPSPLTQAAILWRHGLYFEAHELLEPHWQAASGDEREGLKGLIQAVGVYVHHEAGHAEAAVRLARKAAARLRRYGTAIDGQHAIDVDSLVTQLGNLITTAGN